MVGHTLIFPGYKDFCACATMRSVLEDDPWSDSQTMADYTFAEYRWQDGTTELACGNDSDAAVGFWCDNTGSADLVAQDVLHDGPHGNSPCRDENAAMAQHDRPDGNTCFECVNPDDIGSAVVSSDGEAVGGLCWKTCEHVRLDFAESFSAESGEPTACRGMVLFTELPDTVGVSAVWHGVWEPLPETASVSASCLGSSVGDACWELFCIEHGVQPDGQLLYRTSGGGEDATNLSCRQPFDGRCCRFVDLVQAVVHDWCAGNYWLLFLSDLLFASTDAATDCSQAPRAIGNRIAASDFGRLGQLAGSHTALGVGNACNRASVKRAAFVDAG